LSSLTSSLVYSLRLLFVFHPHGWTHSLIARTYLVGEERAGVRGRKNEEGRILWGSGTK
jgi:hypothetical protein